MSSYSAWCARKRSPNEASRADRDRDRLGVAVDADHRGVRAAREDRLRVPAHAERAVDRDGARVSKGGGEQFDAAVEHDRRVPRRCRPSSPSSLRRSLLGAMRPGLPPAYLSGGSPTELRGRRPRRTSHVLKNLRRGCGVVVFTSCEVLLPCGDIPDLHSRAQPHYRHFPVDARVRCAARNPTSTRPCLSGISSLAKPRKLRR